MEQLGVATKDVQGENLSAIQVLSNLAKAYDSLTSSQRAQIAELVGGVFQVNVLKAALSDLGKEFSIYGNALGISQNATAEATRRNEELNRTLSANLNKTVQNLKKAAAEIGGTALAPAIRNIFEGMNAALEGVGEKDAIGVGEKVGKGIVTGIGNFLQGPGLMLAGVTLFKLFQRLGAFISDAFTSISGLNTAAGQQAAIQERIFKHLSQEPQLLQAIKNGALSVKDAHTLILNQIRAETQAMLEQEAIATRLASSLRRGGVRIGGEKGPGAGSLVAPPRKAEGFIPNFMQNVTNTSSGQSEVRSARGLGASGKIEAILSKPSETIGGKRFVYNSQEKVYSPQKQIAMGLPKPKGGDAMVWRGYGPETQSRELSDKLSLNYDGFIPAFIKVGSGDSSGESQTLQAGRGMSSILRAINQDKKTDRISEINRDFSKEFNRN